MIIFFLSIPTAYLICLVDNFIIHNVLHVPNLGHTILMNISGGARLHPVSAVSWSGDFNAGYLAGLDATAVEIPLKDTLKTIHKQLGAGKGAGQFT